MPKPQIKSEPKPPLPRQKLKKPGLEARMTLRPNSQAPRYRAAGKLEGKVALITGGDSGIGRAVAVLYAREGADVAIACLSAERVDAKETAARRSKRSGAGASRSKAISRTRASVPIWSSGRSLELGQLDILVSNAAHQNRKKTLEEMTDEEFDRTFKTNVYAFFRLVKAALPHLAPGSSIIVTGSETGFEGPEMLPDYAATKGAIHTLTKSLAKMLAHRGIRVNCVAPGPVWTPLNLADTGNPPEKVESFGKKTPLKRPAQPTTRNWDAKPDLKPDTTRATSPERHGHVYGSVRL